MLPDIFNKKSYLKDVKLWNQMHFNFENANGDFVGAGLVTITFTNFTSVSSRGRSAQTNFGRTPCQIFFIFMQFSEILEK